MGDKASVKALSRRFYKLVHPDRFAKYPKQKQINEHSLKQLINLINALSGENTTPDSDPHLFSLDTSHKLVFYLFQKQTSHKPTEQPKEPTEEDIKLFKTIESSFNPSPLQSRSSREKTGSVYSYLQEELKKTLMNLFQQADLPCNFKLESIEREYFWEQSAADVDLPQFLRRYAELAQERSKERTEYEKDITIYRTAFHFQKQISIQTHLPDLIYKQEKMIEIPLQGTPTESLDFVDPIINPYSAALDIYGNEYVRLHTKLLQQLAVVVEKAPDDLHSCVLVFSDKSTAELPHRVDANGRVHLPYQENEEEWLELLSSLEYDQVHTLSQRHKDLKTAENALSLKLGIRYISAGSFEMSTTQEYQMFVQRLIEATNKGILDAHDFKCGLYKKMSLVVIPSDDPMAEDKKFTGDSNGLIVPADCSIERLKLFIANHASQMHKTIEINAKQDDQEIQFIHQLKRRLRVRSIKRDRYVTRRQMLHCCINLRSLTDHGLIDGVSFVAASNLLRVMDDGTMILPWNFSPGLQ